MANPTWPSTLPQYPDDDGSATYAPLVQPVISTSMDTGAPKYRRRFTSVPETFTGAITLTSAQWATLQTFVVTTLADVGAFDWVDFRSGATASYVFTQRPQVQSDQGYPGSWKVTLNLLKVAT